MVMSYRGFGGSPSHYAGKSATIRPLSFIALFLRCFLSTSLAAIVNEIADGAMRKPLFFGDFGKWGCNEGAIFPQFPAD